MQVEIELALECLDNLVFSEECRKEYLRHNFMALLHKSVRMYGMGEKGTILLRRTQRIIWLVTRQGDSPELRKLQHQHAHPVHGRHIFISFGADAEDEDDYPEHVKLLKEALTGAGFRVYCKPAGGDPEEMAEAVSTCSIFMPCATRRYKERAECQFEACYAQDARRPFLPLAMEGEFDRSWGWMHTLTAGKNTVDFSGACQDGSHPAVMLIVNIVMQWIGTPPLTTPPRLATPRQSSPRSTQSVSSPLVLPQQPSAGIVSNQAKMNSPQIPSQTLSSIQHSPQIRDQALPQQQQQKHSSPKALQHSKLPHQQMQNSQTQNAHDTAPGAWA